MDKLQAENAWTRFIAHIEKTDPLIFHTKDGSHQLSHKNFLGAISKYRQLFLAANITQDSNPGITVEIPGPPKIYTSHVA